MNGDHAAVRGIYCYSRKMFFVSLIMCFSLSSMSLTNSNGTVVKLLALLYRGCEFDPGVLQCFE